MKAVFALVILIVASSAALRSAEPSASIKKTEVYGTKTVASIAVSVDGAGIKKPGIYHVPPKTELRDVLAAAEISALSNDRFHVTRQVDGHERQFGFRVSREKKPQLPSFELIEGDFVYAGINLP